MKVGKDPSCDLMLNEVIFIGSTDKDLQPHSNELNVPNDGQLLSLFTKSLYGCSWSK